MILFSVSNVLKSATSISRGRISESSMPKPEPISRSSYSFELPKSFQYAYLGQSSGKTYVDQDSERTYVEPRSWEAPSYSSLHSGPIVTEEMLKEEINSLRKLKNLEPYIRAASLALSQASQETSSPASNSHLGSST